MGANGPTLLETYPTAVVIFAFKTFCRVMSRKVRIKLHFRRWEGVKATGLQQASESEF